jgi:hypothetical protein
MEILLGFMSAAWLFTTVGVAYVVYRYVYKPWTVVRADITKLAQDQQEIWQELKFRKAFYKSDEDLALSERRMAARRLASSLLAEEG